MMLPTADQIARAIVSGAAITGADPEAVARGEIDRKPGLPADRGYRITRARAYAVMALWQLFPKARRAYLALACGVGKASAQSYIGSFEQRFRSCTWWDAAAFRRVVAAIEAVSPVLDAEPKPTVPPTGQSAEAEQRVQVSRPGPHVDAPDDDDIRLGESLRASVECTDSRQPDRSKSRPVPTGIPHMPSRRLVASDDDEDDDARPVMDRTGIAWERRQYESAEDRRARERRESHDLLAEAVRNTAAMQDRKR